MSSQSVLLGVETSIWSWFSNLHNFLLIPSNNGKSVVFVDSDDLTKWLATVDQEFVASLRSGELAEKIMEIDTMEGELAYKKARRRVMVDNLFGLKFLLDCGTSKAQDRMLATTWALINAIRKSHDASMFAAELSVRLQKNATRWLVEGYAGSLPGYYAPDTEGIAAVGPLYLQEAMDVIPKAKPPMFKE